MLDRYLLTRLLQQLQDVQLPGGIKARGPAFWEAASFDAALVDAVTAAGEWNMKWRRVGLSPGRGGSGKATVSTIQPLTNMSRGSQLRC